MALIDLRNVYKVFGESPETAMDMARDGADKREVLTETGCTLALRDVNLSVERGETFVVMGLSGCGKSTLLRHINRLIDPTEGQVVVDGQDVIQLARKELVAFRRKTASMVFQHFALFPHKTVTENTAYGLEVQGVAREERIQRAGRWIENVGLTGYEDAYPHQLSGGMQQRVGLARALCMDPEILLMDEPFSALDPLIRNQMQDQLIALERELHKTIVFITHDLDEALKMGDHVAILKDGIVEQVGGPEEILLNPATDYVREFVKDVNHSRVVTAGTIMTPPNGAAGGPPVSRATVIRDLLPKCLENETPLRVIEDDGSVVGAVSRETVLRALAKQPGPALLSDPRLVQP